MTFAHHTYTSTVEYAFLDILKQFQQNRLWIYPTNIAMKLWYLIQPHCNTGMMYLWSMFTPGYAIDINKHALFFLQCFDLYQIPKFDCCLNPENLLFLGYFWAIYVDFSKIGQEFEHVKFGGKQFLKVAHRWLGHVNDSLYALKYTHDSCAIFVQVSYKYNLK